ncbi:hypothetical protein PVAND_012031 [Polypedilum vanderplanki]|uniref:Uncharacterized protein n=1 Tax=Polypedilum vanderplanki TaxID=319348 RepID=A0A9J6CL75_POLVA|nr:hypothetical protein PVAND_012031 [Polypedilum vanderplanki]
MWEVFTNAEKMLEDRFKEINEKMVMSLKNFLNKFFGPVEEIVLLDSDDEESEDDSENNCPISRYDPDEHEENENMIEDRFPRDGDLIELSDSDNDSSFSNHQPSSKCDSENLQQQIRLSKIKLNNNKKPQIEIPSLSEYKCKTIKLKPAAAYASASKKERQIITVPYKNSPKPKEILDPKEEAKKLGSITQKIYNKNTSFESKLKEIDTKRFEKVKKDNNIILQRRKSFAENKNQKLSLRSTLHSRSKSLLIEKASEQNVRMLDEDEDYGEEKIDGQIPIQKTARPVHRGRRKSINFVRKKQEKEINTTTPTNNEKNSEDFLVERKMPINNTRSLRKRRATMFT